MALGKAGKEARFIQLRSLNYRCGKHWQVVGILTIDYKRALLAPVSNAMKKWFSLSKQ